MKFFVDNKNLIKRISIILIILILAISIIPNYSIADENDTDEEIGGSLFRPIFKLFAGIGDLVIKGLQKIFVGDGDIRIENLRKFKK